LRSSYPEILGYLKPTGWCSDGDCWINQIELQEQCAFIIGAICSLEWPAIWADGVL
jgi:hypothetical protein